MNRCILLVLIALSVCVTANANDSFSSTYDTIVDKSGNISVPENFSTEWTFLGTWSIAAEDVESTSDASRHGAAGLHNVYTQPGVAEHFREHGKFPDGAVMVKELLNTVTAPMTTGTVSRGSEIEGWFIMVKDTEGRFSDSPLWGDGWGWVLYKSDAPDTPVTENYKTECLGCHIPARSNDWIYVDGYLDLAD